MKAADRDSLYDLYINRNMRLLDLANELGLSKRQVERRLAKFGIKKDPTLIRENIASTNLKRYGSESTIGSPEVRAKSRATMMKRYGVENPAQSKYIRSKMRETSLERYGTENPAQNEQVRAKMKSTTLKRHGVENIFQAEHVKEKRRKTNLKKYGVEYAINSPHIKRGCNSPDKDELTRLYIEENVRLEDLAGRLDMSVSAASQHLRKKGVFKPTDKIIENAYRSNIEKYGVDNVFKSKEVQEKIRQTNRQKFGVDYPHMSPEFKSLTAKSNKSKYGVPNVAQRHIKNADEWNNKELFKRRIKGMSLNDIKDYFNVMDTSVYLRLHRYEAYEEAAWFGGTSRYETEISELLDGLGVEHERGNRKVLGGL